MYCFLKLNKLDYKIWNGLIDNHKKKKLNKVSNNYIKSTTLSKSLPIVLLPLTKIGLSIRIG
jgi:predicted transcriptional regulator